MTEERKRIDNSFKTEAPSSLDSVDTITPEQSKKNWERREQDSLENKIANVIKTAINTGSTMTCGKGAAEIPSMGDGMMRELKRIFSTVESDIREQKNAALQEAYNKLCAEFHNGCLIPEGNGEIRITGLNTMDGDNLGRAVSVHDAAQSALWGSENRTKQTVDGVSINNLGMVLRGLPPSERLPNCFFSCPQTLKHWSTSLLQWILRHRTQKLNDIFKQQRSSGWTTD